MVPEQRLQRPQPEDLVEHFQGEPLPLLKGHRGVFFGGQFLDDLRDFLSHPFAAELHHTVQIQPLDQLAVDGNLDRVEVGPYTKCRRHRSFTSPKWN